jgi:hypothetical protein
MSSLKASKQLSTPQPANQCQNAQPIEQSVQSAVSTPSTITNEIVSSTKPFEMNTYVQLEIENSNSLCIPRMCKFNIKKLQVNKNSDSSDTISSIYFAIKLNISKRIMRTIEIPLANAQDQSIISVDLNLHYSIIYPHYMKKDTNYLHIYIQRRKKYKNRTILGYKTLAHAVIDLNSCIQKTIQQQNFFIQQHHRHPSDSQGSVHKTKNRRMSDTVCGYVTISSLSSSALDYNELDRHNQFHQTLHVNKNEVDLDDMYLMYDDDGGGGATGGGATASNTTNSGISAFINAKNKAIHNMNAAISGITGEPL